MKIAKSSGQISQSSSTETHQFKISANGTAFQILSSGLYSNKHAAVLRELGCNAADAHVAAGIGTQPFMVTLPTDVSRDLVIRDFGLGLSHEQVLSLYTTYFSSDKRDSNAFVGGLGLGSKSPFAYTDSFTVTSIHKGTKSIYTCNIAADGAPSVTRLLEEKNSTEASGMEVRLLTKMQDMHLFLREASNVFQWFDTPPTFNVPVEFVRARNVTFSAPAYDITSVYGGTQLIKMGNVVYPLQQRELDLSSGTLWPVLITSMPLVLKSPIGYLQVAASREALQYDPTTKKNLLQLYQQAYNDIARRMIGVLTDPTHTTAWSQESALLGWVAKHIPRADSKNLSALVAQSSTSADAQRAAATLLKSSQALPSFAGSLRNVGVYWYAETASGRKTVERGSVSVGKNSMTARMNYDLNTAIVVADDKQITEKMAHWRKDKNLPNMLLVSPMTKNDLADAKEHAKQIADHLGGVPVMLLSEMPLPGLVVAPTVKRDYVEIDDRMVDVFNLRTGASTSMRFGDVPASMRYVLVRNTQASKTHGLVYMESASDSKHTLAHYDLDRFVSYFGYMEKQGVAWDGPTGAIIMRPVDVDRLKIVDAGIPWLMPSLCAAMTSKQNKGVRTFSNALWPADSQFNAWNKQMNKMVSGWLGDFGLCLNALKGMPAQQKQLRALLKEANLLDMVDARAASTTKAEDAAWTGYSTLVTTLQQWYKDDTKVLTAPLSNNEQAKKLLQEYPLLAQVSSDALFLSVGGPLASPARLQQAFNLLRVCLDLPV